MTGWWSGFCGWLAALPQPAVTATTGVLGALATALVALTVLRFNRSARAGELMMEPVRAVLDEARTHIDATVAVYRALAALPLEPHASYWDRVYNELRRGSAALQLTDYRVLRDRLVVACGPASHVTRAFAALRSLHAANEDARYAQRWRGEGVITARAAAEQQDLVVRQFLDVLQRSVDYATLAQIQLRQLALGYRRFGPLSWLWRVPMRMRNFAPRRAAIDARLAEFRLNNPDRNNLFGLKSESVLLQRRYKESRA